MIAEDLAEYAVRERSAQLPEDVLHHAKRAVIDWFAALVPGGVVPPATMLVEALGSDSAGGEALLYPCQRWSSLRHAALVNATAAHTVEFDDIFRDAIYHPGCIVIAAALAACQTRKLDGGRFLRSVIAGVEISTRIGVVVNPAHYRRWHTTGTVGSFGAAAAVGTALGLDADRLAHALATAGTWAAGLRKAFASDAMSKPLHAGHAADAGALAALAAEKGVTGVLDMLEGPGGFGDTMSEGCDWSGATRRLGEDYNIGKLTFKNHGCCGHTFAAIDGVLVLRSLHGAEHGDVERVDVGTYGVALEVAGNPDPHTAFEAKFSLPFVVATALLHGSVRLDAFTDQRLRDPRIRSLMDRIRLITDPEAESGFPGRRAARLRIVTRQGQELEYWQSTRKGDPDDPLDDQELEAKYMELVAPVVGVQAARGLLGRLWQLEKVDARSLAFPEPSGMHA